MTANTMPADDALRAAQAEYAAALHEVETKRWWELNALSDASAALIQAQAERITALEAAQAKLRDALRAVVNVKRYSFIDTPTGEVISILQEQIHEMKDIAIAVLQAPDDADAGDPAREG